MTDPLDKATAKAPPTVGEGCLSRYDPEALSPEDGTEFPDAAKLWEDLHPQPRTTPNPSGERSRLPQPDQLLDQRSPDHHEEHRPSGQ